MKIKIKENKIIIAIITAIIGFLFSYRFYLDNFTFEVTKYPFELPENRLKNYEVLKGKSLVQISDLHNQSYGKNNLDLINAIDKLKPDYVLLTGDMVSANNKAFTNFYNLVDGISPKYKCFYVVGNHEMEFDENVREEMYSYLKSKGVYVLENNFVCVDDINFYGLNYAEEFYLDSKYNIKQMNMDIRKM